MASSSSSSLTTREVIIVAISVLCISALALIGVEVIRITPQNASTAVMKEGGGEPQSKLLPDFSRLPKDAIVEDLEDKLKRISTGKDRIYFRHMRKAGGTQVRDFVYQTFTVQDRGPGEEKQFQIAGTKLHYFEMEFGALDMTCAQRSPRDNVLTIAVLREPLARIWSEFWYKLGPPKGKLDRLRNQTNLFIQSAFLTWVMREGEPPMSRTAKPDDVPQPASASYTWVKRFKGIRPFAYYSNFQLRMLTGNCTTAEEGTFLQQENQTTTYWCSSGPEKYGGCLLSMATKRYPSLTDLETAKQILSSFDVVLTTDTMSNSEASLHKVLKHAFYEEGGTNDGIPVLNKYKGHATKKKSNTNKKGYPRYQDVLDEKALEYLLEDNAFEIELYRHAQVLAATFVAASSSV